MIGTDDTSVKVLEPETFLCQGSDGSAVLSGITHHPVIVYDYTPTRARAGPAKFLEGYKGYLQADAYSGYDAFFKPERGMTEVGCWMHLEVSVQGSGIRRAAHGTGATPDRTPVYRRGARQGAVAVGGATVGIAPTSIIAAARKLHQYLLELQPGGSAKKSIRRCGTLCAQSVGER